MTTQVRPVSGGAWNNVTLNSHKTVLKTTTWGLSVPAGQLTTAVRSANQWVNCGGVGTAATRAQKQAKGIGLQLQEV